jgi:hypothetical protein
MRRPNEEEERRLILLFAEASIPTEESTSYLLGTSPLHRSKAIRLRVKAPVAIPEQESEFVSGIGIVKIEDTLYETTVQDTTYSAGSKRANIC